MYDGKSNTSMGVANEGSFNVHSKQDESMNKDIKPSVKEWFHKLY